MGLFSRSLNTAPAGLIVARRRRPPPSIRVVDDWLVQVLAIRATPPEYVRIQTLLEDLFGDAFQTAAIPLVDVAADDLARLGDAGDMKAAEARVKRLEADLAARGQDLDDDDAALLARHLAAAYRLGIMETTAAMGWEVSFDLVDQDVIAGLTNAGLFWVGEHYGRALNTGKLLDTVREVAEAGLGRREGGRRLREAFRGEIARSDVYWRGLSATVTTRARSFGALGGMVRTGATSYRYVNPDDERTSEVCRKLNGTVFLVAEAVAMRDQFLTLKTPEDWKTISPWPKVDDLDGLTPGELTAKGWAWPPMHFHCRSSIDVETWTPIGQGEADPIGNVDLEGKAKPPKKPKAPRRRRGRGGGPRSWRTVKRDLDRLDADLARRGLDPDRLGIPSGRPDLGLDLTRRLEDLAWANRPEIDALISLRSTGSYRGYARSLKALEDLDAGHGAADQARAMAAELREVLDLHMERRRVFREAVQVAPPGVRRRWRRDLAGKLISGSEVGNPGVDGLSKAKRKAMIDAAADALEALPLDLVQLAVSEGERVIHTSGHDRAYASPGTSWWRAGYIRQDLERLVVRSGGKWVPARSRAATTLAHELGHRLDGIFGGGGRGGMSTTGLPWKPRPDYPEAGRWWTAAFGDPFEAAKAGGNRVVVLPGEPSDRSRHMWAGSWVRSYEARIYNGRSTAPTDADLADGSKAGPIEFIAMNVQYWQDAYQRARRVTYSTSSRAGVSGRLLTAMGRSRLPEARRTYGPGYFEGMRALLGDPGLRLIREVQDGEGYSFRNDGDVLAYAVGIHVHLGTPLEDLVGKRGALTRYLSEDRADTEPSQLLVLLPDPADITDTDDEEAALLSGAQILRDLYTSRKG